MRASWKAIESAPKDGTLIVGCIGGWWTLPHEHWQAPVTIAWRPFHPNQPGKTCWRLADGRPYYPTHWDSLPSPPKET